MKKIIAILMMAMMVLTIVPITEASAATKIQTTDLRYWGANRYDTAYAVADELYRLNGVQFNSVVVAYGGNFPDALSGGYLAKVKGAPLLLIDKTDASEQRAVNWLKTHMNPSGVVWILGGTGVVRSNFETLLQRNAMQRVRLAGQTALDTNLAILKECGKGADGLLIATATNFADSLSGSSVGKPLMLTRNGALTSAQVNWIKSSGIKKFYVLGGNAAVPESVVNELKSLGTVERVFGQNRYATSKAVADKFFPNATVVTLASGKNFPDGLSGAPLAMKYNSPILLVADNGYTDAHNYVAAKKITKDLTIGGTGAVSANTVNKVMEQYGTAHTHTYGTPTWSWTGYTSAKATFKCTSNDDTQVVNATISVKTTPATTTATGSNVYTATATFNGKSYTNQKTETLPKITSSHTHSYKTTWSYDSSNHWHDCTANDGAVSGKAAHTYGNWVTTKAATELEAGERTRTCSVCGYKQVETVAKLTHTHSYGAAWKYDSSNHWHECTAGDGATSGKTAHTFGSWVTTKQATATAEGEKTRTCSVCGYKETQKVPKVSSTHTHSYSNTWTFDSSSHWHECTANDGVRSGEAKHTFGSWVVTKAATSTADGSQERTCSVCKYKEIASIPKVSHTHTYVYKMNEEGHWQECSGCGERLGTTVTKHNWKQVTGQVDSKTTITDLSATNAAAAQGKNQRIYTTAFIREKNGVKGFQCSVCGAMCDNYNYTTKNADSLVTSLPDYRL